MTASYAAALVRTVDAEAATVEDFVALLEREQEMLVKGQVDDLIELVRQKDAVAAKLATLAAQRSMLLRASGLTTDTDGTGMASWFAANPAEVRARSAWSSLLSLAGQARELNRVNGELIQVRMQHNALALETLMGSNASANLYGPDGQKTPPSGRRISDSA